MGSRHAPTHHGHPGSALAAALLLWIVASACVTSGRSTLDIRDPQAPPPAAPWRHQPLSWEKLENVEAWLESPEARRDPRLRVEAVLQLSEGRLTFARQDRSRADVSDEVFRYRLSAAEAGFRDVERDDDASYSQQSRARTGLRTLEALRDRPAASKGPDVVRRATWGAAPGKPSRMTRHTGRYTRITVHHTANRAAQLGGKSLGTVAAEVRRHQRYHMESRGWGDLGYHYLIDPSGRIFEGRSLAWQGAHAYQQNNQGNVGVCLLGNFEVERPTSKALDSLEALVEHLRSRYAIPRSRVLGHRELRTTKCPGERLHAWVKAYADG